MRSAKTSLVLSATVLLSAFVAGVSPARATDQSPVQPIVVEKKAVTIQDLLKQIQSGQGLNSCASTGNVLGAALTDVQVASLKQAGYTVTQKGDVYDVFSPKSAAAVCDVKSDSKSDAKVDSKIDAKTGDSTSKSDAQTWANQTVENQQKLSASGYNAVKFDGLSPDQRNSVLTKIGIGNSAESKTGAISAGNSADRYESNSVVNPRGGINTDLSVGIGLNVNLLQKVQACDSVVIMGNGALAKVIKDVAKHAFYDRQAWSRFYEPLRDKFMAGEIQSEEFSAKIGKWKIASAVNADELRTQYGDDLIKIAQLCSNKPVTPPGNPPANPPVYREVPPPSTLQACFEVGEKQYEIRTWSSLEAQPGFKKVQNGLCFGRLGALPTVPSLQFVS